MVGMREKGVGEVYSYILIKMILKVWKKKNLCYLFCFLLEEIFIVLLIMLLLFNVCVCVL